MHQDKPCSPLLLVPSPCKVCEQGATLDSVARLLHRLHKCIGCGNSKYKDESRHGLHDLLCSETSAQLEVLCWQPISTRTDSFNCIHTDIVSLARLCLHISFIPEPSQVCSLMGGKASVVPHAEIPPRPGLGTAMDIHDCHCR